MIRLLVANDVAAYLRLRSEALLDSPLAFASSLEDDVASTHGSAREQLERAPEAVVIGAFAQELVGMVGIARDRHTKMAHKAHIWGMYVTPAHRGAGLGRELIAAAIEHGRQLEGVEWVQLGVSAAAPGAHALYTSAGFMEWGREPDALRHGGEAPTEIHMALRLVAPGSRTGEVDP